MRNPIYAYWSFWNGLGYSLRSLLRLSRPVYLPPEPMDDLFRGELFDREKELVERYSLGFLKSREGRENYLDNLLTLEWLDFCLADEDFPSLVRVVDVGARDWYYAPALWHFFGRRSEVRLTGVEIDPFLTYGDGHSRWDYARFYSRELPHARYKIGDFLDYGEKADVVTFFHPFLRPYEHLEGGLPLRFFHPEGMFAHAYDLLEEGGCLVVVNFDYETPVLLSLLETLGISIEKRGDYHSMLADRPARHVTLVRKPTA